MTQPQFDLDEAIQETLFVQTTVDSDRDGRDDRVRIQLSRPTETETEGYRVPVIFEHSPYRSNFDGGVNHEVGFERMPQEGIRPGRLLDRALATPAAVSKPDLPGGLDNYWVPRGYAVVLDESIGTGFSDGCATVGDMKETLVRLLPRQRPGASPALPAFRVGTNAYLGEDLDVLADLVNGPSRVDRCRPVVEDVGPPGPRHRRRQRLLGGAQLPPEGRPGPGERLRRPRPRGLQLDGPLPTRPPGPGPSTCVAEPVPPVHGSPSWTTGRTATPTPA